MQEPIFREKKRDCNQRLTELGLNRDLLVEAVKHSIAARAGVTENDPASAAGYESWRAATRRMRELFLPPDWEKCSPKGVESIQNSKLKIRVSVLGTDENTANPHQDPQNRTPKGAGSESVTEVNRQLRLPFPAIKQPQQSNPNDGYSHWFLCIYDGGETVCAELSCPTEFEGGKVKGFVERILVLGPEEWRDIDPLRGIDDDSGPEVEISVQRKSK